MIFNHFICRPNSWLEHKHKWEQPIMIFLSSTTFSLSQSQKRDSLALHLKCEWNDTSRHYQKYARMH